MDLQLQNEQNKEQKIEDAHVVLIDPPRAGIHKKIQKFLLENQSIQRIIYISCNPKSQMKDLLMLSAAYEIVSGCIVDCYPHTKHLETAILLKPISRNDISKK